MDKHGADTAKAASRHPSVLYVGKFDITSIMDACHQGTGPAQHIHAVSELENHGYRIQVLDTNCFDLSSGTDFALRVMRAARDCDVVLAHNVYNIRVLSLMRALKFINTPLAAFVHSVGNSLADRALLKGLDKLFILTESGKRDLIQRGVPPGKIDYFSYGADASFYRPKETVKSHVLSVGVCGRDFDTLITAANDTPDDYVFVGHLSDAQKRMAGPNITLYADKSYSLPFAELLELYNQAHLVVITHHGTPHPFGVNALLEAMAMGKAVILTKGTGIDIDPGLAGFGITVPSHDPQALQEALQKLLADKERLAAMGLKARRLVDEKYNTVQMGQTLYRGLKELLN